MHIDKIIFLLCSCLQNFYKSVIPFLQFVTWIFWSWRKSQVSLCSLEIFLSSARVPRAVVSLIRIPVQTILDQ